MANTTTFSSPPIILFSVKATAFRQSLDDGFLRCWRFAVLRH
jgi:hypothetical protein